MLHLTCKTLRVSAFNQELLYCMQPIVQPLTANKVK